MRARHLIPPTLCLLVAAACTPLPVLPPPAQGQAAAPQLVPLDNLLASIDPPRATDATGSALSARAARLRARAALMRGPVIAPETRARLAAAIARGDA